MYNYKYKHDEGLFYMGGPIYNCKSKVPLGSSGDGDKHPSCPLINGTVTDIKQSKATHYQTFTYGFKIRFLICEYS